MKDHGDSIKEKFLSYKKGFEESADKFIACAVSRKEYQNIDWGVARRILEIRSLIQGKKISNNHVYPHLHETLYLIAMSGDIIAFKCAEGLFLKFYNQSLFNVIFDEKFYSKCVAYCGMGKNMKLIEYAISKTNGKCTWNLSMLLVSCAGDLEMAKFFFKKGARNYMDCAITASLNGHIHVRDFFIELVLERDSITDILFKFCNACERADLGTMEILIERLPLAFRDQLMKSAALGLASCRASPKQFEFVFKYGVDQSTLERALTESIKNKNVDLAVFLSERGIEIVPEYRLAFSRLLEAPKVCEHSFNKVELVDGHIIVTKGEERLFAQPQKDYLEE